MKKSLACLLICLLLLTACGSGSKGENGGSAAEEGSSGGGSKTFTIWAWDPAFNIAALEAAKAAYAADHPDVNIEIVEYAQNDIIQKLNTGLNSGTTKGLPNIVLIEDYRAQGFLQAYRIPSSISAGRSKARISPTTRSDQPAWTASSTAFRSTPA